MCLNAVFMSEAQEDNATFKDIHLAHRYIEKQEQKQHGEMKSTFCATADRSCTLCEQITPFSGIGFLHQCSNIYNHCLVNIWGQNPVISTGIQALRNFAPGRNIFQQRICIGSKRQSLFAVLTSSKLWMQLHPSLHHWRRTFLPMKLR